MNEPNYLESQLRSWTLRRPSAKIAAKLFTANVASEQKRPTALHWLAPATIGFFSLLVIFGAHPHMPVHPGGADTNLFFASITMDHDVSPASAGSLKTAFNLSKMDLNLEQNVWRSASFESTNLAQSHSSSRSLPVNITNSLTR